MPSNDPNCYAVNGSLIAIGRNTNQQWQQDVLYSVLLSRLVANKQYGRQKDPQKWYELYLMTLESLGWSTVNSSHSSYASDLIECSMYTIAESLFSTGTEQASAKNAIELLEQLANQKLYKGKDRNLLFNNPDSIDNKWTVELSVVAGGDIGPTMAMAESTWGLDISTKQYLSFSFLNTQVEGTVRYNKMSLNEGIYDQLRQQVIDKLGNHIEEDITELNE